MNLRVDLQLIYDWVQPDSHVLDLGCGDGDLLSALMKHKNVTGYGVEIDTKHILAAMANKVNVIQGDLEIGLSEFNTQSFDMVILSQTIQAMQRSEDVLIEMLRIGREAIVSFPNFGYWKNRIQIAQGHMPISENMPYDWYDTPNIHWCTLQDFDVLCDKNKIKVIERTVMTCGKRVSFMPNLLGSLAFYRVGMSL